jgi:prophage antirepressor-like protein
MTEIIPFSFENKPVRVIIQNGEPWFVAKDLCAALHIVNSRSALTALDDTEKGVGSTDTLGGTQRLAIVSESGMWTLVLRCRDAVIPETVPYRVRRWVTSEVLPSIRKTGSYGDQCGIDCSARRLQEVRKMAGAYSDWTLAVRETMKSAGIEPPAFPVNIRNQEDLATIVVGDLLRCPRWLLSFDAAGKPVLQPVPPGSVVVDRGALDEITRNFYAAASVSMKMMHVVRDDVGLPPIKGDP